VADSGDLLSAEIVIGLGVEGESCREEFAQHSVGSITEHGIARLHGLEQAGGRQPGARAKDACELDGVGGWQRRECFIDSLVVEKGTDTDGGCVALKFSPR
jgi:hypothetical protein